MIAKNKPLKNRKYLDWVASLGCCASMFGQRCGAPSVAHHWIQNKDGTMGGKQSDYMTLPLCAEHHRAIHADVAAWEREFGKQKHYITEVVDTLWGLL